MAVPDGVFHRYLNLVLYIYSHTYGSIATRYWMCCHQRIGKKISITTKIPPETPLQLSCHLVSYKLSSYNSLLYRKIDVRVVCLLWYCLLLFFVRGIIKQQNDKYLVINGTC